MGTNIYTDNKAYVSQYAQGTAIQPVDPVFLKPKGTPGVNPHINNSLQIENPAGTVRDHHTKVPHRHSALASPAPRHSVITVLKGIFSAVVNKENTFLSWAKDVYIESRNTVMHMVDTAVDAAWSMLPEAVKNVINNGSNIVKGMSMDDFKGAAQEELEAVQEFLTSPDAAIALAETLALMAAQGIPVVGQVIGGAAAAQRIKGAIEAAGPAVEELKGMVDTWSKPMTPEQMAAARKQLAKWLIGTGIAILLAALGRAGAKVAAKIRARKNSTTPAITNTGKGKSDTPCACKFPRPVVIATGEKALIEADFSLSGPMAINWRRSYRSGDTRQSWHGQGWATPLSVSLVLSSTGLVLHDAQGRVVNLPPIEVGGEFFEAYEALTLRRPEANRWTLSDKAGETRHFRQVDSAQWDIPLLGISDRDGNHVRLSYPAWEPNKDNALANCPTKIIDSAKRELHLTWDPRGLLLAVDAIDKSQAKAIRLASYTYDSDGCLTSARDANDQGRTYEWRNKVLAGYRLATGERFAATYDDYSPMGKVTRSWCVDSPNEAEGHTFTYNERARVTRAVDGLGRITTFYYDERKDIVAIIDPAGNRQATPFDANGHVEAATDPLGRSTSYQFDRRGNLTSLIDPSGASTALTYNEIDLPVTITDALQNTWKSHYDERGHLLASIDPLDHRTQYSYDDRGLPTEVVDARGGIKRFQWSEAGELVAYTDCSNRTTKYDYDFFGNLVVVVDALGQKTAYDYDATQRLIRVVQPDGGIHHYQYDAEDRLVAYTDPLGASTKYRYNANGDPIERTDATGHTLAYRYDAANRLIALVNENGAAYLFRYDHADNLIEEIGFDGRVQRYCYNAAGELTHLIEVGALGGREPGPGKITWFSRDAMGRLIEKRHSDSGIAHNAAPALTAFTYDPLGRLTQATNPDAHIAFAYDALSQLIEETQTYLPANLKDTNTLFKLQHRYDSLGNRIETTMPGPNGEAGKRINWLYYGNGHLHQINVEENGEHHTIVDIERDQLHREIERTQGAIASHYAFDPMGRLAVHKITRQKQTNANLIASDRTDADTGARVSGRAGAIPTANLPHAELINRAFQYDVAGNLTGVTDSLRGVSKYHYDALSRIRNAERAVGNESFDFDPAGNLLNTGHTNSSSGASASNPDIVSGGVSGDTLSKIQSNRIAVFQDLRFEYDEHGNIVKRLQGWHTEQHFRYSPEHQLVEATVTRFTEKLEPKLAKPLRPERVEDSSTTANERPNTTQVTRYRYDPLGRRIDKTDAFGATRFLYDGDLLVGELRGSKLSEYLYEPYSFIPLAKLESEWQSTPQNATQPDDESNNEGTAEQGFRNLQDLHTLIASNPIAAEAQREALEQQTAKEKELFGDSETDASSESNESAITLTPLTPVQPLAASPNDSGRHEENYSLSNQRENALPAQKTRVAKRFAVYYYQCDQIGAPQELTDESGKIVWAASYKVWGETEALQYLKTGTDDRPRASYQVFSRNSRTMSHDQSKRVQSLTLVDQPLRFQGQYFDQETQLHCNYFRYYDPIVGRFIHQDPIGMAGGFNSYQFAPSTSGWTDALGLTPCPCKKDCNKLLPGEGKAGTYTALDRAGSKGDNITPHHMPSHKYMSNNCPGGYTHGTGITMNMEQPDTGGRHRQTRSYGRGGKGTDLTETPRQALARDIRDARRIYQKDDCYTTGIRQGLQDVIAQNKAAFPDCFKK
jgi:RHS repeat-associated protein